MIRLILPLLLLLVCLTSFADEPQPPNVILILADDMGMDSVSALNPNLGMKTPSIDQLVREGISFTDAHSPSGVCSPTRYGVLTGRYSWRSRKKRGIVDKWERPLIEPGILGLPVLFQRKGYATACIGKWHLGWHWPSVDGGLTEKAGEVDLTKDTLGGPQSLGFDYYFGDDVPNWPPYAWRENSRLLGKLDSKMKAGAMVGVSAGPSVKDWDFHSVLEEYTKRWTGYIKQQADETQPFFLFASMPSPHTPIAPSKSFQGKSGVSPYADFLIQTDHAVGQILKALEESGQSENTLVLFTADNGASPKANFKQLAENGIQLNANWRGWKADVYEGGHRVPFVIKWPTGIKAGLTYPHPVVLTDIMATFADVIGEELSEGMGPDSVSLTPAWKLATQAPALHSFIVHHSGSGKFAIRKGKWKLLLCRGSGGWSPPTEKVAAQEGLPNIQLFDLNADPKESTNLKDEYPETVKELTADLRQAIERGRTTPGPDLPNYKNAKWWPGLPWEKPSGKSE